MSIDVSKSGPKALGYVFGDKKYWLILEYIQMVNLAPLLMYDWLRVMGILSPAHVHFSPQTALEMGVDYL